MGYNEYLYLFARLSDIASCVTNGKEKTVEQFFGDRVFTKRISSQSQNDTCVHLQARIDSEAVNKYMLVPTKT